MRLEEIGFYTLSDDRVKQVCSNSPMWRTELLITGRCNFKCSYCRGTNMNDISLREAFNTIRLWGRQGLKNIRFSGGEPTLHNGLQQMVICAGDVGCEHVAISTNGSANISLYKNLIDCGVNDFSISLDACCSSTGDIMAGKSGIWQTVIDNIRELSKLTYVTVGIVITDNNIHELNDIITLAHNLGVADIRIISAAQFNQKLDINIDQHILDSHPILNYRINNMRKDKNVRGLQNTDSHKCYLVMDDSAILNGYHYPCIIYMREKGLYIGKVSEDMRQERINWMITHDTHNDPICKNNCLDVCIDYNNKYRDTRS